MTKPNEKIKNYAKEKKVMLWQVAEKMGMQDTNFSKKLRKPLNEADEKRFMQIIDEIASKNKNAYAEV